MRALAQLVASRQRLGGDTVRLPNRLASALTNSFPQVLQWCDDTETPLLCAFLSRWPTLTAAQRAHRSTREAFFRAHHVRSVDLIASRPQAITNAEALQQYAGITPVTERSGKKSWVHWRRPCPTFLRQTCIAWAAESIRHACWAQASYQQHRDQGKAHQAAVRT